MKKKQIIYVMVMFFLATEITVAQTSLPLPPQSATFTGNTRGYWFTAPIDFVITSLRVPTDASSANQSIVVVKLPAPPPAFSASTSTYTTQVLFQNIPGSNPIAVNISVAAGEIIGVLGSRGNNSINSYGSPNPFNTTLLGFPVSLSRFLMQGDLQSTWPFPASTEPGSSFIGRVEMTVASRGPRPIAAIPTLTEWGIITLVLGLALVAFISRRFRC